MRVIVVGGGVSGLVAARALLQEGHEVTVLEREATLGGTIRSADLSGVRTDVGAEGFAITRPEALDLVHELGIGERVVHPTRSDARLLSDAGLALLPASLMGVPTDLSDPDLAAVVGADAVRAATALDTEPVGPIPPDITLGALSRQRLGDAVTDRLLTPVVAGVHALHPDLIECEAVIPGLLAATMREGGLAAGAHALRSAAHRPGSAIAGLTGGMTALIDALERELRGARIITEARVDEVVMEHGHWHIHVDGRGLDADALVLAVPAPTAARLLGGTAAGEALGAIPVGEVAVVSLVVDSAALNEQPVGSGVLVVPDEGGVQAKAMTHVTAKWAWAAQAYGPGRHLLRLSYGRDGRVGQPLDGLVVQALADASVITGVRLDTAVDARVTHWGDSLVQPTPGHRQRVEAVRSATAELPGLVVVGAGLGGNGIAGAVREARTAVTRLT